MNEHEHQVLVVSYFKTKYPRFAGCIWANVNAQSLLSSLPRNRQFAMIRYLKSEGLKPGVSDLTIAVPKGGKHGLFIEMKKDKGGLVSEPQLKHIELMQQMGYEAVACHGFDAATGVIDNYMEAA